jgi:thioredoxin-dependent peroxiredoxin
MAQPPKKTPSKAAAPAKAAAKLKVAPAPKKPAVTASAVITEVAPAGLAAGAAAPHFSGAGDNGKLIDLAKLKGGPVVLYFYPKDDTPGCTTEAKDFTCLAAEFKAAGATIVGVSPDSAVSHAKFVKKHALDVRLAADEDNAIATAYGVWVEKSMYGKTYMGVERATFLIDGKGKIAEVWRKVKVPGHADAVLAAVKALKS